MIRLSCEVKNIKYVACSGGVDSMALLSFVHRKNKDVRAAFYHHNTPTSDAALDFLQEFCKKNKIKMYIGFLSKDIPNGKSKESFWRTERYKFLFSLKGIVATAHHLNDVAETYLASIIRCNLKLIKPKYKNIVRPFLFAYKKDLVDYCIHNKVPWIEDKTNEDLSFQRNRIRHKVVPEILRIYPGFLTSINRMQKEVWQF